MSLLHKNGILKEYRRQHREELAAQQAAEKATAETDKNNDDDSDDEFPDVAAFKIVGAKASASPSYICSSSQISVMSTMGEGNVTTTVASISTSNSQTRDEERGRAGETNGKLRPSSLTVQTSFQNDNIGGSDASGKESIDERSRQKSTASLFHGNLAVTSIGSTAQNRYRANNDNNKNSNDGRADELAGDAAAADGYNHHTPPRCLPSPTVRGETDIIGAHDGAAVPARGDGTAGLASAPYSAPMPRSRSDLTIEEDRARKDGRLHSPGTDPTVSPTTLTVGVETFLSTVDAAEGMNTTYDPPLRVKSGIDASHPAVQHGNGHNNDDDNSSVRRGINSFSGLPVSPTRNKPHSTTNMLAAPLQAHSSQPTAVPVPQGNSSVVDAGSGQIAVDVSSSSESEAVSALNQKRLDADEHPSMMSEEAVGRLGQNNITMKSFEGEVPVTGGSPAVLLADVSDTTLQPPTSILSELSTFDTATANLASLRSRAQARKTAERPSITVGDQQEQQQQSQNGGSGSVLTPQEPAQHCLPLNNNGDEDAFSRVSETEYMDGTNSPINVAPSFVDTRAPVGPPRLLSFSGTARTLPRIGDDEDVDVDPSSTFTDIASRFPLNTQPITFYEAYMDLIKDMKPPTAAMMAVKARQHGPTTITQKPASTTASAAPHVGRRVAHKEKKNLLTTLFSCCGPHESNVRTRQPCAYASEPTDLDRLREISAWSDANPEAAPRASASTMSATSNGCKEDTQVVQLLKSLPLSLQNRTHRRMLYTVFNVLTGQAPWPHLRHKMGGVNSTSLKPSSSMRPVRWEAIGFQGSNPATDIRATGLLGVLQLLYLMDYYPVLAKRLWDLCQNPSAANAVGDDEVLSTQRTCNGVPNELPFVLVCFNFTALVLDAVGQHLLDAEIEKAKRTHLTPVVSMAGHVKPERHLVDSPEMFVCCESFIGALELFGEAWSSRRSKESGGTVAAASSSSSSLPPLRHSSVAVFGDIKENLRKQILKKNGATLLRSALEKVRGEMLLGFV